MGTIAIIILLYGVVTFAAYAYVCVRIGDQAQAAYYTSTTVAAYCVFGLLGVLFTALCGPDMGPYWGWGLFGPSLLGTIYLLHLISTAPAEASKVPFGICLTGALCAIPIVAVVTWIIMLLVGV